eukprot:scaffold182973_cov36-Tisochrysis_lutea.AAC.1
MASIILDECIDTNSVLQVELEEVRIELSVKEAELEETHSEMEALRDELKVKEDELKAKEDELNLKAAELVQKQTELGERQVELVRKQTELGEKQVELEASQAEKEATQAELETATVTMRHKESELEARQTQLEEAIKQRASDASSMPAAYDAATGGRTPMLHRGLRRCGIVDEHAESARTGEWWQEDTQCGRCGMDGERVLSAIVARRLGQQISEQLGLSELLWPTTPCCNTLLPTSIDGCCTVNCSSGCQGCFYASVLKHG